MLPYKRSQRVSHNLRREVADIIMNRLKDPVASIVTVTDVDVSPDLKSARVYVSALSDDEQQGMLEALERAAPRIRSELGKRLRMRYTPKLDFRLDSTPRYGDHIGRLLKEVDAAGTGAADDSEDDEDE